MSQAADDAIDLNSTVGEEHHVENDVAFQFKLTPFRGVFRAGFFQNGNRRISRAIVDDFLLRSLRYHRGITETTRLNRAALPAGRRNGGAISKTRAGDGAANALVAAGAVAIAGTAGQSQDALARHNVGAVGIALSGKAGGIPETSGLNFLDGRSDGGWRRVTGAHRSELDLFARALGLIGLRGVNFCGFKDWIQLGGPRVDGAHLGRLYSLGLHENVLLLGIELDRLGGGLGRLGAQAGTHFRWGGRRRHGNFGKRRSNFDDVEVESSLDLVRKHQRNQEAENQKRDLQASANAEAVPSPLGVGEKSQTGSNRLGADAFLPSIGVDRRAAVGIQTDSQSCGGPR